MEKKLQFETLQIHAGRHRDATCSRGQAIYPTAAYEFPSCDYATDLFNLKEFDNIYIVDSMSAAIGTGVLIERALELLDEGKSAKEIAETLEKEKENVLVVALIDTLEYLKKGGRISKTVAVVGGMLNIKPVVSIDQGEINILGKARGSKMGNNLLIEEINKAGGVDFTKPVLMGYTGISDALLLKYIEDSRHIWEGNLKEIRYEIVGSVIGTHAGPGAVAVAFFKK